ncbi:MAG: hypothetical protein HC797_01850 [Anaerolineales bacterium]|nr:hypothetical protein [Anaerolineales bacterium]
MRLRAQSPLMKWGVVLSLTVLHLVLLVIFKEDYAGALSILPVGAAGWFFGSTIGIIVASSIVVLYFFILYASGIPANLIANHDFILGGLILILLGGAIGWLSQYYHRQTEKDLELKNN